MRAGRAVVTLLCCLPALAAGAGQQPSAPTPTAGSERVASASGPGGSTPTAPSQRARRRAPDGFLATENERAGDLVLVLRGERRRSVIFLPAPGAAERYMLDGSSEAAFRAVLVREGIDEAYAERFAARPGFDAGTPYCVPLAGRLDFCLELTFEPARDAELPLLVAAEPRRTAGLALIGVSALGQTTVGVGFTDPVNGRPLSSALALTTRGTVASAQHRVEYDLSGTRVDAGTAPAQTAVRYNLLALNEPLASGAAVYAGAMRAASPGREHADVQRFFARSAVLGVGFHSDGAREAPALRMNRIRVLLPAAVEVRIFSGPVLLLQDQFQAGEQIISFPGTVGPFVEVVARTQNGQESRLSVEVLPPTASDVAAARIGASRSVGSLYADLGFVRDGLESLGVTGTVIGTLSWVQTVDAFILGVGAQSGAGVTRLGVSAVQPAWGLSASAMAGLGNERGVAITAAPHLNAVQISASGTSYRPPDARVNCGPVDGAICLLPTRLDVMNLGFGYRGLPARLSYMVSRTASSRSELILLQGSWSLSMLGQRASLGVLMAASPNGSSRTLSLTLSLPLGDSGRRFAGGTLNSDLAGRFSQSISYQELFSPSQSPYVQSLLGTIGSEFGERANPGVDTSAFATVRVGPAFGSVSAARNRLGDVSLSSSATVNHGLTREGLALARAHSTVSETDLFAREGRAGLAVDNRSEEEQIVLVDGRKVTVPARSSTLVELPSGVVRELDVAPGPVLDAESLRRPRRLHKGNVLPIRIEDAVQVLARFVMDRETGGPLRPDSVSRQPAGPFEPLYLNRDGSTFIDEIRPASGDQVERWVQVGQKSPVKLRCRGTLPAQGDEQQPFRTVTYRCTAYRP